MDDKESGPDPFKETSQALNPNQKGRDIREAFKADEYQIPLVANKFQTGFDQPLLCGMYVDKRLAGIQSVQTHLRLNRCPPGKDKTFVLVFVNDLEEVLACTKHSGSNSPWLLTSSPDSNCTDRIFFDTLVFADKYFSVSSVSKLLQ